MMGVMFHELGWMVTIIMIISTASALSLTPMLCSQLLKLNPKHSKMFDVLYGPIQKALDALDVAYAKLLDWSVRHRKTVVFAALSFFVLSMVLVKYVGTEFFPTSDDGRIGVTIETPIGTRTEISRILL